MKQSDDDWKLDMYIRMKARESMKEIDAQRSQYYKDVGEIMRKRREEINREETTFFCVMLVAPLIVFVTALIILTILGK